ncbi:histidinol-phosphate transaminase [Thalassotalea sp. LPB0316]|uniref:histidinol-phosphate transaminase n=1 Tax=Thalassotalea sp. LPB0316 TaxID=2769490 RepID=UPI001868E178|nr:histidinol-phosphate transaminase [Thalassotalea sp. LPB0316]QOL24628.1 histidinol-phosphate transaminase [Thalassotalea sp. LPB0316]
MSQQNKLINSLARPELVEMMPYQSARRLFASSEQSAANNVWLNANEAPGDGAYQVQASNINRYPDFQPENLLNGYSQYTKLPKSQLLATRGADEGIELVIKAFCRAYQDNILICPPTYGMYGISAQAQGVGIVEVPLVNNQLNVKAIAEQKGNVKVLFLCSPGNPTGNLLPKAQILQVLERFKNDAIVVVDEAYIEFSPTSSMQDLLDSYDNLVVLRTLSKAFGLAGLRCGFTLANSAIITMLSKVIAPYPIAAPVAEIASQALTQDGVKQMQAQAASINRSRDALSQWLAQQAWCKRVFDSSANFILFECSDKDEIFNLLKAQNILIRDQSKQPQLENCLRISIGSEQELTLVKTILSQALDTNTQVPVSTKV